ncbi:SDR family NAD(P)-dependent oxidoreductase [Hydrotalea sp.]|uniref:SDR family NAD(P)-dependent oxidoreductase n=1 Tax=Hydrotalea sp. TaxID=2881279 RepID=UPI003D13F8BD
MEYLVVGTNGIGGALATQLAEKNHKVFGTYLQHSKTNTNNIEYHPLNVLDENIDISFLPEKLDGLAYCVGSIQLKPFQRFSANDFIQDYQLQVVGAVKLLQLCLPKLKQSQQASVVLFSTIAVQTGFNFHSLVSASKGAIEGLTKALAAEWAPAIRVNCIAPSITNTTLAQNFLSTPEKIELNAQRHPLKKIGAATDVANLASFLLSPESSWITGQIFHIDGGMSSIKL